MSVPLSPLQNPYSNTNHPPVAVKKENSLSPIQKNVKKVAHPNLNVKESNHNSPPSSSNLNQKTVKKEHKRSFDSFSQTSHSNFNSSSSKDVKHPPSYKIKHEPLSPIKEEINDSQEMLETSSSKRIVEIPWKGGKYKGEIENGLPHGQGKEIQYSNYPLTYQITNYQTTKDNKPFTDQKILADEGKIKRLVKMGLLKEIKQMITSYTLMEMTVYEGGWKEGLYHVESQKTEVKSLIGDTYLTRYLPEGILNFENTSIIKYRGGFQNNLFHFYGESYRANFNLDYSGQWENGLFHGFGKREYEDGCYEQGNRILQK